MHFSTLEDNRIEQKTNTQICLRKIIYRHCKENELKQIALEHLVHNSNIDQLYNRMMEERVQKFQLFHMVTRGRTSWDVICIFIRMYIHTYIHACIHAYIHACIYIHAYTHTYTHTYIHTYNCVGCI